MWISLEDSIHKIFLINVKIFDIKSSLPRTPILPLQSLSISIVILSIQNLTIVYLVFSQSFSLQHFKSVHQRTIRFLSVTIYASVPTPLSSLSFLESSPIYLPRFHSCNSSGLVGPSVLFRAYWCNTYSCNCEQLPSVLIRPSSAGKLIGLFNF